VVLIFKGASELVWQAHLLGICDYFRFARHLPTISERQPISWRPTTGLRLVLLESRGNSNLLLLQNQRHATERIRIMKWVQSVSAKLFRKRQQFACVSGARRPVNEGSVLFEF
jgi:hypothetical protein